MEMFRFAHIEYLYLLGHHTDPDRYFFSHPHPPKKGAGALRTKGNLSIS